MNRKARLSKSERGMAIIVALLAVFVLSILGTSVLFTTSTDEMVSRNYAAEVDALFAANTGLQVGIRNAMVDAMCDTKSQWSNSIIAVGCDTILPSPIPAGMYYDGNGDVTGVDGAYFYDAARFLQTTPGCANTSTPPTYNSIGCDGTNWSAATLGEPFKVDGDNASPTPLAPLSSDLLWSRNGPGASVGASWLPNGAAFRLEFQGVPKTTLGGGGDDIACSAGDGECNEYEKDVIRIISTGMSGTLIQGNEIMGTNTTNDGGSMRRAVRQVVATFKVKDIGIWTNAFFTGGGETFGLRGNATIRGSVHIRNGTDGQASGTNDPAMELKGSASILNHYVDLGTASDTVVISRIPPPPDSGNPHSLEAEFRIRCGNLEFNGNDVGAAATTTNTAAAPLSTKGKGPLDGAYLYETACTETNIDTPASIHADLQEEYDASGFDLPFPDYWDPYTDSCGDPFPNGYDQYLKGLTTGFNGVQGLNLTRVYDNVNPYGNNGAISFSEWYNDCDNKNCPLAFPMSLPAVRSDMALPIAIDGASANTHGNGVFGTNRLAPGGVDNNVDFLTDPNTNIVGVFKYLPGATESNQSCKYGAAGGGHGFLYIPPEVGLTGAGSPTGDAAGTTGFTQYMSGGFTAGSMQPQDVWNWITRTIRTVNTSLDDNDINAFLGRPSGSALNADIGAFVDLDYDGVNDGGLETSTGRLLIAGVMYSHEQDIDIGVAKNSVRCDIMYLGRGTFAVGNDGTTAASLKDINVLVKDWVISQRVFPCEDALGVMGPDLTRVGGTGTTNNLAMMGAFYGRNLVELSHLTSVVGSAVSTDVAPGTMGSTVEIIQIPTIAGCLPPEMIGDFTYYNTRTLAWSER